MKFQISLIFLVFLSIFVKNASAFIFYSTGGVFGFVGLFIFILLIIAFYWHLRRNRLASAQRQTVIVEQQEGIVMTETGPRAAVIFVTQERNDFVPGSSYNYNPEPGWNVPNTTGIYNKNSNYAKNEAGEQRF